MDVSQRVGRKLRVYRIDRGLEQEDIGRRMRLAHGTWTRSTVSQVERGQRAITVDELRDLASILDTTPEALLSEERLA